VKTHSVYVIECLCGQKIATETPVVRCPACGRLRRNPVGQGGQVMIPENVGLTVFVVLACAVVTGAFIWLRVLLRDDQDDDEKRGPR
jgi:hypothetical protein